MILLWGKASSKHSHVVKTLSLVSKGKNVEKQVVIYIVGRNTNWLKVLGGKFGNNLKIWQNLSLSNSKLKICLIEMM